MPSKKSSDTRPDVPARLVAKCQYTGDRLKRLVFYVAAPDLFLTINCNANPEPLVDFVVIEPPTNGVIKLEIYKSQTDFYGVVEWLEFYQLPESDQQNPRIPRIFFCFLPFLFIARTVAEILV